MQLFAVMRIQLRWPLCISYASDLYISLFLPYRATSSPLRPQFKEDSLRLPAEVSACLDVYTKAFEAMKGNRTLVWKSHLGFANIDLEIGDKRVNLTVSPVHAAIIYQFQIKAEWTAEELARTLAIPVSALRRRITYWLTQGLVREVAADR